MFFLGLILHAVVVKDDMDPRGVGYRLLSECEIATLTPTSDQQHTELLTA